MAVNVAMVNAGLGDSTGYAEVRKGPLECF